MSVPPFSSSRSSSWASGSARLSRRQLESHDHILLWALPAIATRMNTGPRLIRRTVPRKVGVSSAGSFQNADPPFAPARVRLAKIVSLPSQVQSMVEWSGTPSSSHAAAAGPRRLQNEYNQGERKSRLIVNNRKIYKNFATEGRAA